MAASTRGRAAARFDRKYYERHYYNPRTAVNTRADMQRLARFIAGYVDYLELPVRRILDAGCGCGWLRAPLRRLMIQASYTGLEYSEYLCERYGWKQGSIAEFKSAHCYELIVCNGVLQYLDDRFAARAIANLARLSAGVLYFNALTSEDWRRIADRGVTDGDVNLRPAQWYPQPSTALIHRGWGWVVAATRHGYCAVELRAPAVNAEILAALGMAPRMWKGLRVVIPNECEGSQAALRPEH